MSHSRCRPFVPAWWFCFSAAWLAAGFALHAQPIGISGVTDRTVYTDQVTLRVTNQAGFTFLALLDGAPVPLDTPVLVNAPDYHELSVTRTNTGTLEVSNRLVRFIVAAGARGSTEWGLPPHTPRPAIPSAPGEFAGGSINLIAPQNFPACYEIPVVAWIENADGHALRVSGQITASNHPSFGIKRGVGSGFLGSNNPAGPLLYTPAIGGLATNRAITIEAGTVWMTVSGTLAGATVWPDGARIHVTGGLTIPNGSSLTVGAGAIVRLNSRVDITNNGVVTINGTAEQPVVWMPTVRAQPWGGFIMRQANLGEVTANFAIFTGSGAEQDWFGANGNPGSHRDEQALFFCVAGQRLNLTNTAAIYLAGQLGHSVSNPVTRVNLTRFLMQRTTSGGEFTAINLTANDSALIECPDDSGGFADADNDGIYLVSGLQNFTNTLIGWTKDDGIDSGASGTGTLNYERCWFEATFHEGNSLSGAKTVFSRDGVYLNCGQGIEAGYEGPVAAVSNCLFASGQTGVRFGDNYDNNGAYTGFMRATNSFSLFNHRDFFSKTWRANAWTNELDQTDFQNNYVTKPEADYPANSLWNPVADGPLLAAFRGGNTASVGLGFATRFTFGAITVLTNTRIPVGLSVFHTTEVQCNYSVAGLSGGGETPLASGTLTFPAGETVQPIALALGALPGIDIVRVALSQPANAELTGNRVLYFVRSGGSAPPTLLVATNAMWRYDTGTNRMTAWRETNFNDSAWAQGAGPLGFGVGTPTTAVPSGPASNVHRTCYFRHAFTVADPAAVSQLIFRLRRDDGAVIYLNESELYRNNMPGGTIDYTNFSSSTITPASASLTWITNSFTGVSLRPGTNWLAVEVHQATITSSDLYFELEVSSPTPPELNYAAFPGELLLYWANPAHQLQRAPDVTGPWSTVPGAGGASITPAAPQEFYRLRVP